MAAALNVYCLPDFLLHDNTENFLSVTFRPQIGNKNMSVFQFQEGLSKSVLVL